MFAADGTVVGLTSVKGDSGEASIGEDNTGMVSVSALCDMLAAAQEKTRGAAPPTGALLPVEPVRCVSEAALQAAREAAHRQSDAVQIDVAGFDIAFITPPVAFAGLQDTMDFGQWSSYVADHPAVLLVRVTPKQVESLWVKMARGAALTQGIALPPIKHFAPGVARMRVLCGTSEVTPVHPFIVERRISETDAVHEACTCCCRMRSARTAAASRSRCTRRRRPTSARPPRSIPRVLKQIWDDMAPFRP